MEEFYYNVLLAGWVVLFTLGTCLLLNPVSRPNTLTLYDRSRKITGVAFLFFGLQVHLQWMFDIRETYPYAATALMSVKMEVVEKVVAEMAGFSSASYFVRRFSKQKGMPPMQWRKSGQGK